MLKNAVFGLLPGILLLLISTVGTYFFVTNMPSCSQSEKGVKEITWADLLGLDDQSGEVSPDLLSRLQGRARIAGFVVPLTDNFREIKEFLLVPDAMSCIHVPPPPSNQMILVSLDEPIKPQLAYGPVWVYGDLKVKAIQSEFGNVSYQMQGVKVKTYEDKNWRGDR